MSETPKKKTAPKTTPRKTASKKRDNLPADSSYVAPTHHEVELLAYRLWVDRGRHHGDDAQDWLRAEEQLRTQ
jgi:hypothetical protein